MDVVQEKILQNIRKNGFPGKKVTLPFRPVFDACKEAGLKLSDVLKELEKETVFHTMKDDKILFHDEKMVETEAEATQKNPFDMQNPMYKKAMEQMEKMDPEQLKSIQEKIMNMSPEEREKMMKMAQGMS